MQHNNEANVKKREMIEYDFYKDMKPFVDMVDEELKVWKELAYEWIKEENRSIYMYSKLIKCTIIYKQMCCNAL